MAKRVGVDKWLFSATLLLVVIGVVMVFSASAVMAGERFGSPYHFLLRQLGWASAGLLVMTFAMNVDYRRLKHPAVVYSLLAITTLLLIAVFLLDRSHHTHRWVRIGSWFSLQPSELAKPALIVFLSFFLETRSKYMDDWRHTLLPAVIPVLLFAGLIVKQPDLGTAAVCVVIAGSILYLAGAQLRYFGYALIPIFPVLYFLLFHVAWRRDRILAFINPYADPQGRGFHVIQSLIAVGTGGLAGMGLMEGKQKLFFLPEPHTDFIYAVVSEELGLIGGLAIVILFAIFAYRGLRAAQRTHDLFGRYMAIGITTMVVVQAFLNISVVLALLPTKGIPLPFVSYGGSSLFMMLGSVGVLLNISQQAE